MMFLQRAALLLVALTTLPAPSRADNQQQDTLIAFDASSTKHENHQHRDLTCDRDADCRADYSYCFEYKCVRDPPPLRDVGDDCIHSDECYNDACAWLYGVNDHAYSVCCPSGQTMRWKGDDYCTGLPVRSPCAIDDMCERDLVCIQDGSSAGGGRGGGGGICLPRLGDPGDDCIDDQDCKDHLACGYEYGYDGHADSAICCYSGETVRWQRELYCTGLPVRSPCAIDAMCAHGLICLYDHDQDDHGTCGPPPPKLGDPGDHCDADADCKDYLACGYEYGSDYSGSICCHSGDTIAWKRKSYCTDLPKHSPCAIDEMCADNLVCILDDHGSDLGKCGHPPPRLGDPGDDCNANDDCKSGLACGLEYGSDYRHAVCCHSSGTVRWRRNLFCAHLPVNSPCAVDDMCADGLVCDLDDHVDGGLGTCRRPLPPPPPPDNRLPCKDDYDCPRGFCDYGLCSEGGGVVVPVVHYVADMGRFGTFMLDVQGDDSSMDWTASLFNLQDIRNAPVTSSLEYYLGVQWTNPNQDFGAGNNKCSRAVTGDQYDPTLACGPDSAGTSSGACRDKDRTPAFYWEYHCFPNDASKCAVGDLSGKFGPLAVRANRSGSARVTVKDDRLSASNDDFVRRTTQNSYHQFASIVFVDPKKGKRVLCGRLRRISD